MGRAKLPPDEARRRKLDEAVKQKISEAERKRRLEKCLEKVAEKDSWQKFQRGKSLELTPSNVSMKETSAIIQRFLTVS
ncbi:hypothetical protein CDAR_525261 [Caerostris darwini]|uniref:Uncharacterized protein n=1 Tax=Caerostris darwini TaxID=1538125 RepID=A0AAV4U0Z2_9ARAC|nr:hypothetical protein CDAR_525261 [Caerostris darwini]